MTVTMITLSPDDRETAREVPWVLPLASAMVTLAPSSLGSAVTVVDDTSYPTMAE